jgi:hypothetical protein
MCRSMTTATRGLITAGDQNTVTGLRIMSRADGSAATEVPADLVIDASWIIAPPQMSGIPRPRSPWPQ